MKKFFTTTFACVLGVMIAGILLTLLSIAALTAFSGVFALGAIFAIFGSVKLKLQEKLGIDDAKASQLISAMMFSCLVFSIVIGAVTPALGFKVVGLLGFAACGGGRVDLRRQLNEPQGIRRTRWNVASLPPGNLALRDAGAPCNFGLRQRAPQ